VAAAWTGQLKLPGPRAPACLGLCMTLSCCTTIDPHRRNSGALSLSQLVCLLCGNSLTHHTNLAERVRLHPGQRVPSPMPVRRKPGERARGNARHAPVSLRLSSHKPPSACARTQSMHSHTQLAHAHACTRACMQAGGPKGRPTGPATLAAQQQPPPPPPPPQEDLFYSDESDEFSGSRSDEGNSDYEGSEDYRKGEGNSVRGGSSGNWQCMRERAQGRQQQQEEQ